MAGTSKRTGLVAKACAVAVALVVAGGGVGAASAGDATVERAAGQGGDTAVVTKQAVLNGVAFTYTGSLQRFPHAGYDELQARCDVTATGVNGLSTVTTDCYLLHPSGIKNRFTLGGWWGPFHGYQTHVMSSAKNVDYSICVRGSSGGVVGPLACQSL